MSAARPRAGVLSHSYSTEGTKKPRATIRETDAASAADKFALGAVKDVVATRMVTRFLLEFFHSAEIARQVGQRSVGPLYTGHPIAAGKPSPTRAGN
jgi:hypothetical protein